MWDEKKKETNIRWLCKYLSPSNALALNTYGQNNSSTYYISNQFIDNTNTHIPSTNESEKDVDNRPVG